MLQRLGGSVCPKEIAMKSKPEQQYKMLYIKYKIQDNNVTESWIRFTPTPANHMQVYLQCFFNYFFIRNVKFYMVLSITNFHHHLSKPRADQKHKQSSTSQVPQPLLW